MREITLVTLATAIVRETWVVRVPDDADVNADNALDFLPGYGEGVEFVSVEDETVGDERDRQVMSITDNGVTINVSLI